MKQLTLQRKWILRLFRDTALLQIFDRYSFFLQEQFQETVKNIEEFSHSSVLIPVSVCSL